MLGHFALGPADVERLAQQAGINSDDRLPLEFSAPRALYLDTHEPNARQLRRFRRALMPDVTPDSRIELERGDVQHAIGIGHLNRGALGDGLAHLTRAIALDAGNVDAMFRAGPAQLRLRNADAALRLAGQALAREPANPAVLLLAGLAAGQLNQPQQAVGFLQRAVAADPQSPRLRHASPRA